MKTTLQCVAALAAACSLALTVSAQEAKTLKVGDKAPAIAGKDQDGKDWKLADALGKKSVLVYFYPKDNTPGCTKQACGLRDRMGDLQKDGVEVIGVSFDDAASHKKFIADHSLNFRLLADTDGKVADALGARITGRSMAKRVSFLISKDGKIAHITDNRDAMVHLSEMKDAVAKLK